MKIYRGKEEIVYLLTKVIEKFESENSIEIVKNSNRKNYESIARLLSEISKQLPYTAQVLEHDNYQVDHNPIPQEYPFRKYDITGNQIKDAFYHQIVSNPRSFLVDACYIYLYGKGRKGFEKDPVDGNLVMDSESVQLQPTHVVQKSKSSQLNSGDFILRFMLGIVTCFALFFLFLWQRKLTEVSILKKDMKILPYTPSKMEIDSLEGIWLSYIGSPQARISDPNRFHMVVANVLEIKHKKGYFVINRYGASFNHDGYAQFESPWIVSIHTYVKNGKNGVESPRHSLMCLDKGDRLISVISASWNFDIGDKNNVIGIREVYSKLGKNGRVEEVLNTIENAACKCKIIRWHQENGQIQVFQLKNQLLDQFQDPNLKNLIDEKSILLKEPNDSILLQHQK